jgi:uncharacterized repeat protein (TIGR01451 family)
VRLELVDCVLNSNAEDDVFLNDVDASASAPSLVRGCAIEPSGGASGMYVDGCDHLTVDGNTFSDVGGGGTWGLGAQQCTDLRVEENLFRNFDDLALILQASSASHQPLDDIFIRRNTFEDNATNLKLTQYENAGGFGDLSISNNFFQGNYGTGVLLDPGSFTPGSIAGVNIWNNSFAGATLLSADNRNSTPVNAGGNWWGVNDPAAVAAQVSANVDYSPWLASGTDIDPGAPGFEGDFSSLWVDDDSPRVGAVTAIQEGINAVLSGGTVTAAPGNYGEQVFVNKPATVTSSSGAAVTVIDGPDDWPYVVRIQSSNVVFNGFTVTNPAYLGGSDASGIIVTENPAISNVRISNNVVHDIGSLTRSPVVYGSVGINIGQCSNIEVDHNEIYNIKHGHVGDTWAQGISIWGNGPGCTASNINIHHNSIHDVSSPNNRDSGVGIQGDVSGITVADNVIQDTEEYGVDTWNDWAGAYSPTAVSGNTIRRASIAGINMVYDQPNPITANLLDGCGTGILIAATGGASSLRFNSFTGNVIHAIDNRSAYTLDASWCYWDSPHGPSYGAISYGETFNGDLIWRPYLNAVYGGTPPATPIQVVTASPLPGGKSNLPYSVALEADGGVAPYTWFLYAGDLPPGLSLSDDGVLSGTPTASGSYTFYIEAGDSEQADFKEFSLSIDVAQFTVEASVSGGHGKVVPASQSVPYGGSASIDIQPDAGYRIASIVDNGAEMPVADPYVIENVTSDHSVVVTFAPLRVGFEKTASPSGEVVRGQVITYTLRLTNNDALPVSGASITDSIPAYTAYVSHSTTLNGTLLPDMDGASPLLSGLEVHSPGEAPGVIAAGEEATVTFMVQVGRDLPLGASVRNLATARADGIGTIEAGCINASSAELPSTWYFAEGSTQAGFDEYILLCNMGENDMAVTITYLPEGGSEKSFEHFLPAHSRQTVYVNAEMPGQTGLAAIVTGSPGLICERSMYYRYRGIGGGDDSIGANAPSVDLFFAEGYTGYAESPFDEWILVLNPNQEEVNFTIDYLYPGGGGESRQYTVPARQRMSISVDSEVGEGHEVSARLRCEQPLVAERSMYFTYKNKWSGGHIGAASTVTRNDWYLAEGYTGWKGSLFDEWILVSNQNDRSTPVTVTYMFPDGSTKDFSYSVAANARLTVSADQDVGEGQMISAHVRADLPVVVERAMYFDYRDKWMGGHNSLASPTPASQIYFAEGYTGNRSSSFESWLLIQNTSDEAKTALVEYILKSGEIITEELTLAAHSRTTVDVNRLLDRESLEFSMRVSSGDGSPTLLAERAMYFSYTGSFGSCQGGHDVVGY